MPWELKFNRRLLSFWFYLIEDVLSVHVHVSGRRFFGLPPFFPYLSLSFFSFSGGLAFLAVGFYFWSVCCSVFQERSSGFVFGHAGRFNVWNLLCCGDNHQLTCFCRPARPTLIVFDSRVASGGLFRLVLFERCRRSRRVVRFCPRLLTVGQLSDHVFFLFWRVTPARVN